MTARGSLVNSAMFVHVCPRPGSWSTLMNLARRFPSKTPAPGLSPPSPGSRCSRRRCPPRRRQRPGAPLSRKTEAGSYYTTCRNHCLAKPSRAATDRPAGSRTSRANPCWFISGGPGVRPARKNCHPSTGCRACCGTRDYWWCRSVATAAVWTRSGRSAGPGDRPAIRHVGMGVAGDAGPRPVLAVGRPDCTAFPLVPYGPVRTPREGRGTGYRVTPQPRRYQNR